MSRIRNTGVVDPDRVGSASVCLIRIRIGTNSKQIVKVDKLNFFSKNFQYAVQKWKIMTPFYTDEKDETSLTGNAVTESKTTFDNPKCVKLGVRSACGSA
jgi:hypothetical protein